MSYYYDWRPYVPVAQRRAQALQQMDKLRKKGKDIQPVEIEGRTIGRSFWGKGWCDHLDSFSDYANRLPRGRTYVRNGSVCHLEIQPGRIEAIVSGSELYHVEIDIKKLKPVVWQSVKRDCSGQIGSMLELLRGRLSDQVMSIVTDRKGGLFPQLGQIEFKCSCPDWAVMCKHVAAVLYGVGSRLDNRPELLFLLRDVDAEELISAEISLPAVAAGEDGAIADDQLGGIFGIDLDVGEASPTKSAAKTTQASRQMRKSTPRKKQKPAAEKGRKTSAGNRRPEKTPAVKPSEAAAPSMEAPTRFRPTGQSVARLRKQLGLSVEQFAKRIGVTAASIYRWEASAGELKLQARPLADLARLQQKAGKRRKS